jgi:hypothetical protein
VLSVNSKGAKNAFIGACVVSEKEGKEISQKVKQGKMVSRGVTGVVPEKPKATVFASCYPLDAKDFEDLKKSMHRLALNDASVIIKPEASTALGSGFRIGFLGQLHMEVFTQRLVSDLRFEVFHVLWNSGNSERCSDLSCLTLRSGCEWTRCHCLFVSANTTFSFISSSLSLLWGGM